MKKCSYNGTILLALPERDAGMYPHALIYSTETGHALYFTQSPFEANETGFGTADNDFLWYSGGANGWYKMVNIGTPAFVAGSAVWTNTDILNADGTLYLAASEPVPITAPVLDPLSLWLGWKAGNWVARQRGKKAEPPEEEKTPIAYLYNGVQLPDINAVWTDKETYPYVAISSWYEYDGAYVLFLTDGNVYCVVDSNGVDYTAVGYAVNYAVYIFAKEETGNAWLYQGSNTTSDSHNMNIDGKAIWCNNAVLNLDGSVYLAASEPVPVYE